MAKEKGEQAAKQPEKQPDKHKVARSDGKTNAIVGALALGAAFLAAESAAAAPIGGMTRELAPVAREFIAARSATLAPIGAVVFCARNSEACRPNSGPSKVRLNAKTASTLRSVNRSVNRAIAPQHDSAAGPLADEWTIAPKAGDCEDYALTKRQELIARGIPARALRVAVTLLPWGEGHAVLVVRTDRGDLVLDNRTDAILPWRDTGLSWVSIQSGENPRRWFSL